MRTTDQARTAVLAILLIAGCGTPAGPLADPAITCLDVPQVRCDEAVANALRSLPNTAITTIDIVCVAERCTDEAGAMDTIVRTADGGTLRSPTNAWSQPAGGAGPQGAKPDAAPGAGAEATLAPAPDLTQAAVPLQPQCQAVPLERCELMAETAFGEISTTGVEHVLVRCGTLEPCTLGRGVGETVVTYEGGSTQSSAWEYEFD